MFPIKTEFRYIHHVPAGWFRDVATLLNTLWLERQRKTADGTADIRTLWSAKPTFADGKLASITFEEVLVTGAQLTGTSHTVNTGACSAP